MGDLLITVGTILVLSVPLVLSVWALLDAARRPRWVWAFAERNQVGWMVAILLGGFLLVAGLAVSLWYLRRVRPTLAAVEAGRLQGR